MSLHSDQSISTKSRRRYSFQESSKNGQRGHQQISQMPMMNYPYAQVIGAQSQNSPSVPISPGTRVIPDPLPQSPPYTLPQTRPVPSTIMIGSGNSINSPRVYRPHSPVAYAIFQNSTQTTINVIRQLSQENEQILTQMTTGIDSLLISKFVKNANMILEMSRTLTSATLPFYSHRIELPPGFETTINPWIQTDLGLHFSPDGEIKNIPQQAKKAMSLPGRASSPSQQ